LVLDGPDRCLDQHTARWPDSLIGMGRRQKGTARPADVRPTDVRPTDVQPVDAQSTVVRSVDVRPVDVDGVRTVAIVTVGWGVAFVILALRQGVLNDAGRGWWLWTCLAGVGLGLLGLEYCRRRRDAIAQAALDAEAGSDDADDPSLVGDWSRMPDEADDDTFGGERPQADQQVAAEDHLTQPYQPADTQTGYTTGDMPPVPSSAGQLHAPEQPSSPRHRAPVAQHSTELAQPGHLPPSPAPPAAPPLPPAVQRQAPMPPASGRPSQPSQRPAVQQPVPQRPAAQSATPTSGPPGSPAGQQPPRKAERPSRAPSAPPPAQQPEAPPPDPYSTGAGWYDAPAGYSPDPDRARRHPRDRKTESQGPTRPEPVAGQDRPRRSSLEDSEFFGAESSAPPPNSTAEFLLADLADDDDQQQEPQPPSRHDRDAPDDDYRGRRARRPR